MKSSAMRDLMAVTARPEVISLAGGLPDTSRFPPETFAAVMSRIARESCAKALQYGPTEGLAETKDCIVEVMRAEGMRVDPDDMIVTTGGQQVIDLVTKTLIDPGDVIVCEAPDLSRRRADLLVYEADVVQIEMDADGMRIDLLEEALDRLEREGRRPKFIYTVPTFQNPAGVTMSLERRRGWSRSPHERELLVLEDNPYGLLRYEGEPLPTLASSTAALRDVPRDVLEDPLARHPAGLGRGARRRCSRRSTSASRPPTSARRRSSQLMVQRTSKRPLARLRRALDRDLRARRDTMLDALAEYFPPEAEWTRPAGGLFIWATLPDYIDTTDLLARALRDNVAFVPGAAAYLDGRGQQRDAAELLGVGRARRSARASAGSARSCAEQVALYGTLTGEPGAASAAAPEPRAGRAQVGRAGRRHCADDGRGAR